MKTFARAAVASAAGLLALAAAAPALAAGPALQARSDDVTEPVLWTVVGVALLVVAGGVLYLFKRQLGGFPEHPDWVAPIQPIYSRELPVEPAEDHEPAEVRAHQAHGHDPGPPAH
jgi:hypothetical protein